MDGCGCVGRVECGLNQRLCFGCWSWTIMLLLIDASLSVHPPMPAFKLIAESGYRNDCRKLDYFLHR